jgi:predicted metal-dependent phosphoesterase TrpH
MNVLSRRITDFPADRTFIEIPFEVGADVERIEVSYSFPAGSAGSVIDIGLAREGRSRGWTGSEYGHVWVAEDRASAGYLPGPLAGRWQAVLGIVKVGPGCFVDLEVRLVPRRPVWLAGELHSHTEHSDGGVPVTDALARARASGCDFVALTDHNTTAQNRLRPEDTGLLVIPGMELTTYWGHTNLLGLPDPLADWRCRSAGDVPRRMAEAREAGATIVVNHPFQRSAGGRWQVGPQAPFDALEIWNGNWKPEEAEALALWQQLLAAGRRVPAVGGSDFHLKNRRRHARPANRLHAGGRSVADVLAAVRAGAGVIAATPDGTMALPLPGTPAFGPAPAGAALGIAVTGLAAGDELRLWDERGLWRRIDVQGPDLVLEEPLSGRFLRLEVWRGAAPVLLANPHWAE